MTCLGGKALTPCVGNDRYPSVLKSRISGRNAYSTLSGSATEVEKRYCQTLYFPGNIQIHPKLQDKL